MGVVGARGLAVFFANGLKDIDEVAGGEGAAAVGHVAGDGGDVTSGDDLGLAVDGEFKLAVDDG